MLDVGSEKNVWTWVFDVRLVATSTTWPSSISVEKTLGETME